MKLKKKALLPAIAMVLASVIALSGVTYAWFTTGNTAKVDNLNVNVQTANGIQISLDASSWRSTLSGDDIIAAITGATSYSNRCIQVPEGEIAPVSSAGNIVDGKLEMFYGEYKQDGTMLSAAEVEQNRTSGGNFIAFDIFFKSSMDQTMTLNLGDAMSYVKGIDMANGNADTTIGTEKAVRVAFIPMGYASTPADARALTVASGTADIWEPNSGSRADGVEADAGKLAYNGFKAAFDGIAESELGDDQVAAVTTFDSDYTIELKAGINKVRVYIWLEGQDVDCINNISFGDFAVSLYFTVPEITE